MDWLEKIEELVSELPEEKRSEATRALKKVFKPDLVKNCEDKAIAFFMDWMGDVTEETDEFLKNLPHTLRGILREYCKCIKVR